MLTKLATSCERVKRLSLEGATTISNLQGHKSHNYIMVIPFPLNSLLSNRKLIDLNKILGNISPFHPYTMYFL